jgi:hypothetical protein
VKYQYRFHGIVIIMETQLEAAEKHLLDLEQRVLSVERVGVQGNADDSALRDFQGVVLEKLKSIRSSMLEEVGDIAGVRRERDAAVAASTQQGLEIQRQNYRIAHLIKALNEAQKK